MNNTTKQPQTCYVKCTGKQIADAQLIFPPTNDKSVLNGYPIPVKSLLSVYIHTPEELEALLQKEREADQWISVNDRLPETLETVWISNGKGWTTLGCRSDYHYGDEDKLVWCWAKTNGIIYEEDGKIISECEEDDLDVTHWMPLPQPPKQ